jgi:hypothetical protein
MFTVWTYTRKARIFHPMKPRTNLDPAAAQPPRKQRRYATISPYGRVTSTRTNNQKRGLRIMDGTSPEGCFLRRVQKQLIEEHLGGNATVPQRALVNRIAWIELRMLLLDKKAIEGNETPYDVSTYLAHANSAKRMYQALGFSRPSASFAELLGRPPGRSKLPPEAAD